MFLALFLNFVFEIVSQVQCVVQMVKHIPSQGPEFKLQYSKKRNKIEEIICTNSKESYT
jgi:hypothetical protein